MTDDLLKRIEEELGISLSYTVKELDGELEEELDLTRILHKEYMQLTQELATLEARQQKYEGKFKQKRNLYDRMQVRLSELEPEDMLRHRYRVGSHLLNWQMRILRDQLTEYERKKEELTSMQTVVGKALKNNLNR